MATKEEMKKNEKEKELPRLVLKPVSLDIGTDGFYNKNGKIFPAKIVRLRREKIQSEGVEYNILKTDIVYWTMDVGGYMDRRLKIPVGVKDGCFWPDLKELRSAIEYERKGKGSLVSIG